MSIAPKNEVTRQVAPSDDLEQYVIDTANADPAFRASLEDAESLQRLLDCLTSIRRDRNISQSEVANRMGVRQPTVSGFEKASSDPKLSTLQRYARAVDARIRFVVEPTSVGAWPSRSTQTYTRGASTPRAVRAHKDGGLIPAWKNSRTRAALVA